MIEIDDLKINTNYYQKFSLNFEIKTLKYISDFIYRFVVSMIRDQRRRKRDDRNRWFDSKININCCETLVFLNFEIKTLKYISYRFVFIDSLFRWWKGEGRSKKAYCQESERRKRNRARNDNGAEVCFAKSRPKAFALLHSTHSTYCETYLEPLRTWVPRTHLSSGRWVSFISRLRASFFEPWPSTFSFSTRCAHYGILNHR